MVRHAATATSHKALAYQVTVCTSLQVQIEVCFQPWKGCIKRMASRFCIAATLRAWQEGAQLAESRCITHSTSQHSFLSATS